MDLVAVLALFLARLAGGYAFCLALFGPGVREGSWRRVSLFLIAGLCLVAFACRAPASPALATAAAAIAVERALAFRLRGLATTLWMAPFGVWLVLAAEWGHAPGFDSAAGSIAAGGTLGAMLLGHSYLTARNLSFKPLRRMARLLFWILVVRALTVAPAFFAPGLEMMDLVFLSMRAALGLGLPIVLAWMALQCVKIESNQSATGILYAMTVLVCVFGELIAAYLKLGRGIAA